MIDSFTCIGMTSHLIYAFLQMLYFLIDSGLACEKHMECLANSSALTTLHAKTNNNQNPGPQEKKGNGNSLVWT